MAYEYDVFISYRSKSKEWVEELFLPIFKYHLQEAVGGRDIDIFIDSEGIEGGDVWPLRLRRALAHSRCLVPILLPSYFHSKWCAQEFAIMEERCRKNNLWTVEHPGVLIVPVCISDGDFFPEQVKELKPLPCHEYHRVGSGFKNLEPYNRFQTTIIEWTHHVAHAIARAPNWSQEWLNKDWLDVSIEHLLISPTSIKAPMPKI